MRRQHVDELEAQVSILGGVPAKPPDRGAFVAERIVVADEQDEAQSVGEVDVTEFGRDREREVRVPGLEGALERWVGH